VGLANRKLTREIPFLMHANIMSPTEIFWFENCIFSRWLCWYGELFLFCYLDFVELLFANDQSHQVHHRQVMSSQTFVR